MAQAKKAWKNMSAALARARKAGFMPEIDAGQKVRTAKQAARKPKAQGKKKTTAKSKSKSSRPRAKVGV